MLSFFATRKTKRVFEEHFRNACKVSDYLKGFDEEKQIFWVDIFPLFFTITDRALTKSGNNSTEKSEALFDFYFSFFSNIDSHDLANIFGKRALFYEQVIAGKPVHADCFPHMTVTEDNTNFIFRCALAFTDCVFTPSYVLEDYDTAPRKERSYPTPSQIADNIYRPIAKILLDLYNTMYSL